MNVAHLTELTAAGAASSIRARHISSLELVEACLDRIATSDRHLRAWACVDEAGARREAANRDRQLRSATPVGPLHGVPIGVKDVIDVDGLPTGAGFAPFAGRRASGDATVVRRLEAAGAVVLGKTVTTQFAYADPAATRNPWSADRTPGGSSSGSGAAVAARHVPLALATQTGGSTLRPAAFTGCVGFKPSWGLVPCEGVVPLAWSMDHVGAITRDVEDCRIFLECASRRPLPATGPRHPRLGVIAEAVALASAEVRDSFAMAVDRLAGAGASIVEVRLPVSVGTLRELYLTLLRAEARAVHWHLIERHAGAYGPRLRSLIEDGAAVTASTYVDAQRSRWEITKAVAAAAGEVHAFVLPTVQTTAPSRDTTGDSSLQSVFSVTGLPAISLPAGMSAGSLPHAMQLAAAPGKDALLLAVARRCAATLGPCPAPELGGKEDRS